MRTTVRAFGDLISVLDREITIDLEEGASLGSLFNLLSKRAGESSLGHIGGYKIGEDNLVAFVNGRNINTLDGFDTSLGDGNMVILIPLFEGG